MSSERNEDTYRVSQSLALSIGRKLRGLTPRCRGAGSPDGFWLHTSAQFAGTAGPARVLHTVSYRHNRVKSDRRGRRKQLWSLKWDDGKLLNC